VDIPIIGGARLPPSPNYLLFRARREPRPTMGLHCCGLESPRAGVKELNRGAEPDISCQWRGCIGTGGGRQG